MTAPNGGRLQFVRANELRASTPPEPEWVLDGYLARGAVTLLAGRPKAGKSTLAFAIADAIASGVPTFLDHRIAGGPVVYVSEEHRSTLAHKLPSSDEVWVLPRDLALPKPGWRELVQESVAMADRVNAVLLVVDTWAYWASLPKDAENDAGAAGEAMQPLLDAATKGLAVLLPLHSRKGGGKDGEGVRGTNAITGAADIVLELECDDRQRELTALSRYPSTPGSLMFDLDRTTGSWAVVGEGDRTDSRAMRDRLKLLAALHDAALTRTDLEGALDAPARQWQPVMSALIDDGKVVRTGAGKKGDPFLFELVRTDSEQHPAQKCAETPGDGEADSGARHVVTHQNRHNAAQSANGARGAGTESNPAQAALEVRAEDDAPFAARAIRGSPTFHPSLVRRVVRDVQSKGGDMKDVRELVDAEARRELPLVAQAQGYGLQT